MITSSQTSSGDKLLDTLLFDTNIVGIFVWDFDGRILHANDAFLRIVGYEREDLVADRMRWSDLTPPDLLERQAERIRQHQTAGRLPPFEKEYIRKDGTRVPVLVGVSRFQERANQGVGFVLDLSERKRAEEEHLWFLASMDRINRALQGTNDLERMMSDVLEAALEVFACDRAWLVYPCDPQAASWRVVMERTRPEFPGGHAQQVIATDADAAAAFADARARRGVVLDVPSALAKRFGIRSRMAMALYPKGDAPYLFGVHQCSGERAWTADEQRLFEDVGHRLTDALSSLIAFRSLRESERRLEAAQRLAQVGWWERDYVTGRVTLSDEACRIFAVQPADLPQWQDRWLDLVHPEDRERVAAASEIALQGGPRYDVEYRVVKPDGVVRVVHSQGDVSWDESGRPLRQFGAMQDITELWQAEQELRARQEMLDLAQKAARAVAFDWYIGARESENRWSPELEMMFGLDPGTFDRTYHGWKKLVHTDDLPSVTLAIKRAQQTGDVEAEYRVIHKDGSVHWLQTKGRVFFDAGGRPERMVGFMIDVTDRKRAEESLRQSEAYLAESQRLSHTGSWALDLATDQYLYRSEESNRMWGFDARGEKPTGQTLSERIHPEDWSSWKRNLEKSLREDVATFDEYRIVLPDGTVKHLRTIRHRVLNSAGQVVRLVGTSIDITEHKRAEEERETLRRLEAELAHANRLTTMGELTASIAHEVNQPLGAMVANAGACTRWLAAEPPETVKARRALESIAADGRRASEIIGRIRALVKRQAPRKDPVDVNLKIAEVIELTADEIRRNGIVLRTELSDGLPTVHGDRVQLQQVLLNLILNAIDAMGRIENRPGELTIASRRDGAEAVLIEVRDVGPGIDPKRAAQVFEPFYTTKSDGLGIGLSISRSIVEAHGGRLWVNANAPHGAVFRFSLPVGEAAR